MPEKEVKIASTEETNLCVARDLIEYARDVLTAHQLTRPIAHAPDLVPIAEYLLTMANCKYLYEVEKAHKS